MLNLLRPRSIDPQTAVETVSNMVAGLFEVEPTYPQVAFATPNEIEAMQIRRGEISTRHESDFLQEDNAIVVAKPESTGRGVDSEGFLYKALAYELAWMYQKIIGRYNRSFAFDLALLDKTRLRSSDGVPTLVLPKAMVEESVIQDGKFVAADVYCQLYVLNALKKRKTARATIEEAGKWPNIIKQTLDSIRELTNEVGNYDKVRSDFRDMDTHFRNEASNPLKHPNFNRVKLYLNLGELLSYWLAGTYRERMGDVESFRGFVRTPAFPTTQQDRTLFGQSLQQLNQYLTANNSLALGYNKLY